MNTLALVLLGAFALGSPAQQSATARFEAAKAKARPIEQKAESDLAERHFDQALKGFQNAAAAWRKAGFDNPHAPDIAECYLGLGQFTKVIATLKSAHAMTAPLSATCASLAYLHLNQETTARTLYQDQFITQYLPSLSYMLLPPKKTRHQFEATLHLARGVSFFVEGAKTRSRFELTESDRLNPNQPLTSYFLGKLFLALDQPKKARPYLLIATHIKGPLGVDAQSLLK